MSIPEHEVLDAMRVYGGGFVQALAVAFSAADETNFLRLKAAFPDIWLAYTETAKARRERPKT